MSSSRVKRRYDAFAGEDAPMSPQCSPLRITSLGAAPQPEPVTLPQQANPFALSSSSSSSAAPPSFASFSFSAPTAAAPSSASAFPAASSSSLAGPSYRSPAPLSKRTRKVGQSDVAMDESDGSSGSGAADSGEGAHASPFPRLKRPAVEELMFVPRHFKKQATNAILAGPSSAAHASAPNSNPLPVSGVIPPPPSSSPSASSAASHAHQLFTYEQVVSIVRNALDLREEQLRSEYDRTLQELLREQFENFSMFNRDYISRSMKALDQADSDNSYYS